MKISTKFLCLTAIGAACYALPGAASLLAGTVLANAGWVVFGLAALLIMAAATALFLVRRGATNKAGCNATKATCSCASAIGITAKADVSPEARSNPIPPIACTLSVDNLKERIDEIRALARETLLHVCREPLALHLTYAADASDRVREMVTKERACCAFLRFDLFEDVCGVHLTIIAPEEARDIASELFTHFAPELTPSEFRESSNRASADIGSTIRSPHRYGREAAAGR